MKNNYNHFILNTSQTQVRFSSNNSILNWRMQKYNDLFTVYKREVRNRLVPTIERVRSVLAQPDINLNKFVHLLFSQVEGYSSPLSYKEIEEKYISVSNSAFLTRLNILLSDYLGIKNTSIIFVRDEMEDYNFKPFWFASNRIPKEEKFQSLADLKELILEDPLSYSLVGNNITFDHKNDVNLILYIPIKLIWKIYENYATETESPSRIIFNKENDALLDILERELKTTLFANLFIAREQEIQYAQSKALLVARLMITNIRKMIDGKLQIERVNISLDRFSLELTKDGICKTRNNIIDTSLSNYIVEKDLGIEGNINFDHIGGYYFNLLPELMTDILEKLNIKTRLSEILPLDSKGVSLLLSAPFFYNLEKQNDRFINTIIDYMKTFYSTQLFTFTYFSLGIQKKEEYSRYDNYVVANQNIFPTVRSFHKKVSEINLHLRTQAEIVGNSRATNNLAFHGLFLQAFTENDLLGMYFTSS